VLPGASSKPNLPAIKSIIKFDAAKRSPKRLLPSRVSTLSQSVTALRRQPWLFSLTTALLLRAAAFYLSLGFRFGLMLVSFITQPQRGISTPTSTSPSRHTIYDRRLLLAGSGSITWYESRDLNRLASTGLDSALSVSTSHQAIRIDLSLDYRISTTVYPPAQTLGIASLFASEILQRVREHFLYYFLAQLPHIWSPGLAVHCSLSLAEPCVIGRPRLDREKGRAWHGMGNQIALNLPY
jgi:hypothetical protein